MKKIIYTENGILKIAQEIIAGSKSKNLCFYGEMGAGKTTLIKALVKTLGKIDVANSPSFGIVNEYQYPNGKALGYHFDFYRINDEIEALDLGFDDYLNQDLWVFIEWPEKISSFLPENTTDIFVKVIDAFTREIHF